tara:strand:- start:2138 stop:2509 length:372 start_codon:yes stop_codon:yes gene_type:complete
VSSLEGNLIFGEEKACNTIVTVYDSTISDEELVTRLTGWLNNITVVDLESQEEFDAIKSDVTGLIEDLKENGISSFNNLHVELHEDVVTGKKVTTENLLEIDPLSPAVVERVDTKKDEGEQGA